MADEAKEVAGLPGAKVVGFFRFAFATILSKVGNLGLIGPS